MTLSYVALGGNLDDPAATLASAAAQIESLTTTRPQARSPLYRSDAVGPGEQPEYLNAVIAINTQLEPLPLLRALQQIETDHGRVRSVRWGARTLDLDLLLYGEQTLNHPDLQIPHPRMTVRNFVLYPLFDIAPQLTLPCGTPLASLLARCPRKELQCTGELRDPG